MYISIIAYIESGVLHNAVAFLIEADNVAYLNLIGIDLITAV